VDVKRRTGTVLLGSIAIFVAAAVACSSSSMPPLAGNCDPTTNARCGTSSGTSGSSGGEGGTSSACQTDAGTACDECAAQNCCSEYATCASTSGCVALLDCEDDCLASADISTCQQQCQTQYPAAASTLQLFTTCATSRCTICSQSGVGDPCSTGYAPCTTSLSCNGRWCTKDCSATSDCAGIGVDGDNVTPGTANTCVQGVCVPGCNSNTDCQDFPASLCNSMRAIDGTLQSVCTSADGGL
jgi:hypothetical protein